MTQRRIARRVVIGTELFMAVAALGGGIALMRDPLHPIGMSQEYISPTRLGRPRVAVPA